MLNLFSILILQIILSTIINGQVIQPKMIQLQKQSLQQSPQKNQVNINLSQFSHAPISSEKIGSIVAALQKSRNQSNMAAKRHKNHYLADMLRESAIRSLMAAQEANRDDKFKNGITISKTTTRVIG
nr:uncharacterized protein LOC128681490 [Plodia interpunctella]